MALDLEAVVVEWAGRAGKAYFGKKTGRRSPIFFCLALLSYICFDHIIVDNIKANVLLRLGVLLGYFEVHILRYTFSGILGFSGIL